MPSDCFHFILYSTIVPFTVYRERTLHRDKAKCFVFPHRGVATLGKHNVPKRRCPLPYSATEQYDFLECLEKKAKRKNEKH